MFARTFEGRDYIAGWGELYLYPRTAVVPDTVWKVKYEDGDRGDM